MIGGYAGQGAKTIELHKNGIKPGGSLIYDSERIEVGPIDTGLKIRDIESDMILIYLLKK